MKFYFFGNWNVLQIHSPDDSIMHNIFALTSIYEAKSNQRAMEKSQAK